MQVIVWVLTCQLLWLVLGELKKVREELGAVERAVDAVRLSASPHVSFVKALSHFVHFGLGLLNISSFRCFFCCIATLGASLSPLSGQHSLPHLCFVVVELVCFCAFGSGVFRLLPAFNSFVRLEQLSWRAASSAQQVSADECSAALSEPPLRAAGRPR